MVSVSDQRRWFPEVKLEDSDMSRVFVSVKYAECLVPSPSSGCDPYVKLFVILPDGRKVSNERWETRALDNKTNPHWDEAFDLMMIPSKSVVVFLVLDDNGLKNPKSQRPLLNNKPVLLTVFRVSCGFLFFASFVYLVCTKGRLGWKYRKQNIDKFFGCQACMRCVSR